MWLRGVDGSMVQVSDPKQLQRRWPPEACLDNPSNIKVPKGFKIVVVRDLADEDNKGPQTVTVVVNECDTASLMNKIFAKHAREINRDIYIEGPSCIPIPATEQVGGE